MVIRLFHWTAKLLIINAFIVLTVANVLVISNLTLCATLHRVRQVNPVVSPSGRKGRQAKLFIVSHISVVLETFLKNIFK
jgi:hypothetical protein